MKHRSRSPVHAQLRFRSCFSLCIEETSLSDGARAENSVKLLGVHTPDYDSSRKCCISWCFATAYPSWTVLTQPPAGLVYQEVDHENIPKQTKRILNAFMQNLAESPSKLGGFGAHPCSWAHVHIAGVPTWARAQHPDASASVQRKANNKRRPVVPPSRLLSDVQVTRSWDTPQHASPDTA